MAHASNDIGTRLHYHTTTRGTRTAAPVDGTPRRNTLGARPIATMIQMMSYTTGKITRFPQYTKSNDLYKQ